MSEMEAIIDRGLDAVARLEAKVNGFVRCSDCSLKSQIRVENVLGDGYCPSADCKLVGYAHNGKALSQPRRCGAHQPNGKEVLV